MLKGSLLSSGLLFFVVAACTSQSQNAGSPKVTNGKKEEGFPFVVQIMMDQKSYCTGSFVSDSLLITAAHCIQRAATVTWNDVSVTKEHFFINDGWPTAGTVCNQPKLPKFDLALVRFPDGTYTGNEFGKLLMRDAGVGETFTIVGYGHSLIEPYETFCRLPEKKDLDGLCHLQQGQRQVGAEYKYDSVFSYKSVPTTPASGCPVECGRDALKQALLASGLDYDTTVATSCSGNFRDRPYKESGLGTKRSGSNSIKEIDDGVAIFTGSTGGEDTGLMSASGAGDSGGPLFITENGLPLIAAVTHGGSLTTEDEAFRKKSMYSLLQSVHNREWLKKTVIEHQLNMPQLLP